MNCEFDQYCKDRDLMYWLRWEGNGFYEIEISSAAKSECFYMKRCSHFDLFKNAYEEHLEKQGLKIDEL